MPILSRRASVWAALAVTLGLAATGFAEPSSARLAAATPVALPQVRVNQVGYPAHGPKVAYAMLTQPAASVTFTVSGPSGVVFHGTSTTDLGPWNSAYPAVFSLDFSALARWGRYRISVLEPGTAAVSSAAFSVTGPSGLYHQLVVNAVRYFTSERDGPNVVHSVMDRQPANLTDEHAWVYAAPAFDSNGPNPDDPVPPLKRIGGPVNVAGGWFDAGGGYERFAYTTSYADALLLMADRNTPGAYPTLDPEAQFGLSSLERMWDPKKKVLYIQVGIGNGSAPTKRYPAGLIQGDYNFWFLPQAEDRMNVTSHGHLPQGPTAYYVKYRPVFEAAPPGKPIDPDFAGRFAADFALGAQVDAARHCPGAARRLLALARGVYTMAKTTNVGQIVTTYPSDYYGGTEWKSDMLWGSAEIALADEALRAPAATLRTDLATAARWARAYIAQGHPGITLAGGRAQGGDTFNLYDNGAVGEAELLRAMRQTTLTAPVPAATLLTDMAAQLKLGEAWARVTTGEDWQGADPFGIGMDLGHGDASPHAFGLYITDALYQEYGGSPAYESFAQQQLNFALGANAWGTSFVVGAGTTFPHCMQSEIANLIGSHNGGGLIQAGATTDGPSGPHILTGLPNPTAPGQRPCSDSPGYFGTFDTPKAAYLDNTISWPTVEPSLDYTAAPLLAFTLAGQGIG